MRSILNRYHEVRRFTEALCQPLQPEDYVVQSMPDASPTKWHIAHTTWFFETFLLAPHLPGYEVFHPRYSYLFNSYYNGVGERHARPRRGMLSRPSVEAIYRYRAHVDAGMTSLLSESDDALMTTLEALVEIGLHHEQQHQELLLTDLKHMLAQNPLRPAYTSLERPPAGEVRPLSWSAFDAGVSRIGHESPGFCFDNERPRHQTFVHAFELASRLVTNGEYLAFVEDGGYSRPELWLSEGWDKVCRGELAAPLYWEQRDHAWHRFSLHGLEPVRADDPVCHVSYFEAEAYARWAGARLPTEAEWEVAASGLEPTTGNFVESGMLEPRPASGDGLSQLFGDVWEWTASSYLPYPGYQPLPGTLGEYNGKFMANQMVLRGGSCATSASHIRATYRNFFPTSMRWQFCGFRLARDAG